MNMGSVFHEKAGNYGAFKHKVTNYFQYFKIHEELLSLIFEWSPI